MHNSLARCCWRRVVLPISSKRRARRRVSCWKNSRAQKIYADISQEIYELKVAAENEVAKEESKLEGLLEGRLVEEEVEMLQHQSNLLESELANYEERKMRTLRFLDWHTKNAALHKKYAEAMANSVAANNEYLLLRDKEKALSRYDAVLPFRESYDAIKHLLFSISQNKETARNIKEKQTFAGTAERRSW